MKAIEAQKIKDIICLGDVASTGPQPLQVIHRLQEINCPVIMGNMDAWLLNPQVKEETVPLKQRWQDIDLWCARQLSSAERSYLSTFKPSLEYLLSQETVLFCYHGSPGSYNERIMSTTSEEELESMFLGIHGDIMVGGHTHIQLFRRYKDSILLNPGSVGLAMDRVSPANEIRNPSWAEYAIVDTEDGILRVELHRIPFDLHSFTQAMLTSGMPHAHWWANQWIPSCLKEP